MAEPLPYNLAVFIIWRYSSPFLIICKTSSIDKTCFTFGAFALSNFETLYNYHNVSISCYQDKLPIFYNYTHFELNCQVNWEIKNIQVSIHVVLAPKTRLNLCKHCI